jgi:competence protein ComEA
MNRIEKLLRAAVFVLMLTFPAGCGGTGITVVKQDTSEEIVSEEPDITETDVTESEPEMICVFICGAVRSEGVYYVPADSRVNDVLNAAGGFSEEASTSAVNLAGKVFDGDRIYIPKEGEEVVSGEADTAAAEQNGLVNINTAGKEELMTLPGIGETRAEEIIKYREQHGGFTQVEDLMNVNGIKEGTFSKLRDKVTT